jgi:hypothetical protein
VPAGSGDSSAVGRFGGPHRIPPPVAGRTWRQTVESGWWADAGAEEAIIPAAWGLDGGVWFPVGGGIPGLLLADPRGRKVASMVCAPAEPYHRVMTGGRWQPAVAGP